MKKNTPNRINIDDDNNNYKKYLPYLFFSVLVIGGWYEAGRFFNGEKVKKTISDTFGWAKKTNQTDSSISQTDSQSSYILDQQNSEIQQLENKIVSDQKKLDSIILDKNSLKNFQNIFQSLKNNYKLLTQIQSNQKIQSYISQKQILLDSFEKNIILQQDKINIRIKTILDSISSEPDLTNFLTSDVTYTKKEKVLSDQKKIFEKRKQELEVLLIEKSQLDEISKNFDTKNIKNFSLDFLISKENKYTVWENSLYQQKIIADMMEKSKPSSQQVAVQNPNVVKTIVKEVKVPVYVSAPRQTGSNSWVARAESLQSPTTQLSVSPQPAKQSTKVASQVSSQINQVMNGVLPEKDRLYVIAKKSEWVFGILKRYKIQPSNQLVQEFYRYNWKRIQEWGKYFVPKIWKTKFPLISSSQPEAKPFKTTNQTVTQINTQINQVVSGVLPEKDRLYVIAKKSEWVFGILKRYKIQPSNQLVQEFYRYNWKKIQEWGKYFVPKIWKTKFPLK